MPNSYMQPVLKDHEREKRVAMDVKGIHRLDKTAQDMLFLTLFITLDHEPLGNED
jgi:hypothetical protein